MCMRDAASLLHGASANTASPARASAEAVRWNSPTLFLGASLLRPMPSTPSLPHSFIQSCIDSGDWHEYQTHGLLFRLPLDLARCSSLTLYPFLLLSPILLSLPLSLIHPREVPQNVGRRKLSSERWRATGHREKGEGWVEVARRVGKQASKRVTEIFLLRADDAPCRNEGFAQANGCNKPMQ